MWNYCHGLCDYIVCTVVLSNSISSSYRILSNVCRNSKSSSIVLTSCLQFIYSMALCRLIQFIGDHKAPARNWKLLNHKSTVALRLRCCSWFAFETRSAHAAIAIDVIMLSTKSTSRTSDSRQPRSICGQPTKSASRQRLESSSAACRARASTCKSI